MSAPAEPARTISAAGKQLVAAGFQRRVWPGKAGAWIYEHHDRHNSVTIHLDPQRGHQVVIHAHWDPHLNTWIPDHEYGHDEDGRPYDIASAVEHGIRLATERTAA